MHKLGVIDGEIDREFRYSDCWAVEPTSGPDRMVIAPSGGHVDLLQELAFGWAGGYFLLYVLVVSRCDNRLGRYESPGPLDFAQVRSFCGEFGAYLEDDGRHHFWVGSTEGAGTLVYDQHNVIFAYGDLGQYRSIVSGRGLVEESRIRFPSPHTHQYNSENDEREQSLLGHWDWKWSPLKDGDEY